MLNGIYGSCIRNDGRMYFAQHSVTGIINYVENNAITMSVGTAKLITSSAPSAAVIKCSMDGKHMIYAYTNINTCNVSNDYGITWVLKTMPTNCRSLTLFVSRSGRYMGWCSLTANLYYISNNFGATFTQYNWIVGASSAFSLEET